MGFLITDPGFGFWNAGTTGSPWRAYEHHVNVGRLVTGDKIPPPLIVAEDQQGLKMVPASKKVVQINGLEDKRQVSMEWGVTGD